MCSQETFKNSICVKRGFEPIPKIENNDDVIDENYLLIGKKIKIYKVNGLSNGISKKQKN